MAQIILAETASVSTPSAATVALYADTTANPQLSFKDDGGNLRVLADGNNTLTMANKTFTAPVLGAATGTSVIVTGAITTSGGVAGVGYATGAGGTSTQITSRATAFPALNKTCGKITFFSEALAAGAANAPTMANTSVVALDHIVATHISGGTIGAYALNGVAGASTITWNLRNVSAGSLTEAPVFKFTIIKGVES